jgi:hypothetical protein
MAVHRLMVCCPIFSVPYAVSLQGLKIFDFIKFWDVNELLGCSERYLTTCMGTL